MKLTDLQKMRLREAHRHAAEVLRQVKQKPLKGKALKDMKYLEEVVSTLEVLVL